MADDVERAAEYYDVLFQANLTRKLREIEELKKRQKDEHPVCEFCEENPVAVSPIGVYLRFCERCIEEIVPPT